MALYLLGAIAAVTAPVFILPNADLTSIVALIAP